MSSKQDSIHLNEKATDALQRCNQCLKDHHDGKLGTKQENSNVPTTLVLDSKKLNRLNRLFNHR